MRLSKKIFIFSSVAFFIVMFFGGTYLLVFRDGASKQAGEDGISQDENAEGSLIEKIPLLHDQEEKKIQALTDEAVLSPSLTPDGQFIRYYSKSTGQAYELDFFTGKKRTLSGTSLADLVEVSWSPDTTKVISRFSAGPGRSKFSVYDYVQKKGRSLDENIFSAAWQNNGKIIYAYLDPMSRKASLNISGSDGSDWQKITDLAAGEMEIAAVPMSGLVSFWNKQDSFTETLLQSSSVISGEKKDLVKGWFGGDFLWSPDGNFILESTVDRKGGSKMQLGIVNSSGQEYRSLAVPTLVSKCVWSRNSDFVYYAHPTSIPENAVMPNDYLENKFSTNDTFWKINIRTGEKTRLISLEEIEGRYDATSLFLNANESLLFFINKIDGKLYQLSI